MGSRQRCGSAFLAGCSAPFLLETLKVLPSELRENGGTRRDTNILPSSIHLAPESTLIGHLRCSNEVTKTGHCKRWGHSL